MEILSSASLSHLHKFSNKENLLGFSYNTVDTDRGIDRYASTVIDAIVMEMWTACGTGGTVVQSVLAWMPFFPTLNAKMFYFLLYYVIKSPNEKHLRGQRGT